MKRRETVKDKKTFSNIINNGTKITNRFFFLYYISSDDSCPSYGVAVSKKLGNSVVRNKLKRRYRNIIDNNKMLFSNNNKYIIMIRKESLNASFNELMASMKEAIEKVKK